MADVVGIDEHRPHDAGPVVCARCQHTWVAVRPSGATSLECGKCGAHMGGSLLGFLMLPEFVIGDDCCGQTDNVGTCCAPACIRGTALKLIDTIRLAYNLEHTR